MRPSAYLGIEISKDPLELLNPCIGDLMLSIMEEDTFGANKAKKKIARRRHDFIDDGNAKSYAKIFKCATRMRKLEDCNKMLNKIKQIRRRGKQRRRQHWKRKGRRR